ncbi:MAG TPA: hypothetical protein VJA66_17260 [Thermoanaerobaculia bacterium]
MSSSLFYRIAAVLLVLFAIGHTLGFRETRGMTGADSVVSVMKSVHFTVQGFQRVYYDFFVGFGLLVTAFFLFSALLSWQLASVSQHVLAEIPWVTWGFVICFLAVTILSWAYFFLAPVIFSILITACLMAAAILSGRS